MSKILFVIVLRSLNAVQWVMSKTYLNGKLTLTSLAAPTSDDVAKIRALSNNQYKQFQAEVRDQAHNSPVTDITVDEIWEAALKEARKIKSTQQYAL